MIKKASLCIELVSSEDKQKLLYIIIIIFIFAYFKTVTVSYLIFKIIFSSCFGNFISFICLFLVFYKINIANLSNPAFFHYCDWCINYFISKRGIKWCFTDKYRLHFILSNEPLINNISIYSQLETTYLDNLINKCIVK